MAKLEGACAGNQFEATDKAEDNSNQGKLSYVITSWQQFEQFKNEYFKSEYLNKIPKSYFKHNKLGVVFVIYTGSVFLHNERLYYSKDRCVLSYEIWDRKLAEVPACIWSKLYIVKFKK
jgi:hypothetical protein